MQKLLHTNPCHFPQMILAIICWAFILTGCKKSSDVGINNEIYAEFEKSSAIAEANDVSVSIKVKWSKSKWTLIHKQDGFVTGFTPEQGGDEQNERVVSDVRVLLKPNLSDNTREEEIIIKSLTTGQEHRMTITQKPLSGSDRIAIDPSMRYQKVTGFGGMINCTWTGSTKLTVEDIDKLYGSEGLGLNIGRLMIYPNSSSWSYEVEVAKRAQEHGAILFGTPWTPPPALKSVNTNSNENGEYLLPENYAAFANHLKSYVDYYKSQGVDIYAVSVQNEPDWKVSYDGCSYTPQQMLDFVKGHGRSVGTKLIVGETVQFNKAYTDPILSDPVAVNQFDIVGTHLYGFNFSTTSADYPLARQHNKEVWMTEHLFNETTNGIDWAWEPSLKSNLAVEIHNCMKANMNAYIYWYLKRYYSLIGENRDPNNPAQWYTVANGEITKRGYIVSHYAKYATGRTRIEATLGNNLSSDDFLVTAYAGNKDITIVLINRSNSSRILELGIPSDIDSASSVITTNSVSMQPIDCVLSNDRRAVRITAEPLSILSVKVILK